VQFRLRAGAPTIGHRSLPRSEYTEIRITEVSERGTVRDKLRSTLTSVALIAPIVALIAFVIGAVLWFIASAKGDGTIDAGSAFAGLGYMGAALAVVLLTVLGARLLGMLNSYRPADRGPRRPARRPDDRAIIHSQLAWGSGLVITGAIVGLICLCFVHPSDAVAGPVLALATAVIGSGATLLPAGAASAAGTRIQQQLGEAADAPEAKTTSVTRTGPEKATALGTVLPGATDVEAYFEYRDTPHDGPLAPIAQVRPGEHISARAPLQTIEKEIATLEERRAYEVRLVAETPSGQRGEGDWVDLPKWQPLSDPAR
jgi:hypothetical protein